MISRETRQVYNLFQDLWNEFIILKGGQRVKNPFGAKALQTDNHTGLVGAPDKQKLGENFQMLFRGAEMDSNPLTRPVFHR